jgi:hypothetical protein
MKLSGMYKDIATIEELPLIELHLTEKLANEISKIVCSNFDILHVPVLLKDKEINHTKTSYRKGYKVKRSFKRLGTCFCSPWEPNRRIELYFGGHDVSVLLHEIAHLKEPNHFVDFYIFNIELLKWFKETLKEKIFPSIETILKEKESEEKPNMEKSLKRIVEELECEAEKNVLKMRDIGKILLEEKLNTAENIQIVKMEMIKRGFKVV